MRLYYLTPSRNVPGILKRGLVAGRSSGLTEYLYPGRYKAEGHGERMKSEKRTLYFTDDSESMGELVKMMKFRVSRPGRFTILRISLPEGHVVEPDERQFGGGAGSLGGFLRSNVKRVPPSNIRVLGSVIVKPEREATYSLSSPYKSVLKLGERSSELMSILEMPESEEEEEEAVKEIKSLPSSSKAHRLLEEREKRRAIFGRVCKAL